MIAYCKKILTNPYIEKWYWGFLLQGAIVLGLAPILIPVIVGKNNGSLEAGVVVAAFYLGQLASPFFGIIADKLSWHKVLYLGSYVIMGLSVFAFILTNSTLLWFILSLIIGLSAGAGNTISAMYIVEITPHQQWDQRIGWLQTFYGTGQALGLFAAALFATTTGGGMTFAALLMIPGFFLSWRKIPKIINSADKQNPQDEDLPHKLSRHSHTLHSPLGHYQQLTIKELKIFSKDFLNSFGILLLSWFLATFGLWLFMNLYPLLMEKSYKIAASTSSTYYAVFATIGAFAYAPSGTLGKKIGNNKVLFIGMLMLFLSLLGLSILCYSFEREWKYFVPAAFAMIPIAWSPLIVAGTALASELTTIGQGAGLGLFNAMTALSSVLAALAAGWIAHHWDYPTVTCTAAVLALLGIITLIPVLVKNLTLKTE